MAGPPGPAIDSGFCGRIRTGLSSIIATVTHCCSLPPPFVIVAPVSMLVKRAGRNPSESSTSSIASRTVLPRVPAGRSIVEVPSPIRPLATSSPSTSTLARVAHAVSSSSPGPGAWVTETSDRSRSGPVISHHDLVIVPPGTQAVEAESSAACEARWVRESK